jgi:hypothetical protein
MAKLLVRVRLLAAAGLLIPVLSVAQTVVSCPTNGEGDQVTRGFYILNYTGPTLGTVQLTYYTDGTAGTYTISLTARLGTYDGALLGTQSMTANLPAGPTQHTYDFGGVAVAPGSTITFTQVAVAAPGIVFYDTGPCGLGAVCASCPTVFETEDTAPPLSVFRRNSVGVAITPGGGGPPPPPVTAAVPTLDRRVSVVLAAALAGIALLLLRRSV